MEEIWASRGEGLVMKHPLSEYTLNGRTKDWIKVKPEYMVSGRCCFLMSWRSHLIRRTIWARLWTFSLLVSGIRWIARHRNHKHIMKGGNYGSGRRAGGVSTLICAVVDDRQQPEDDGEVKSVDQKLPYI